MGFNFRKSITILPGIKLNIGKKGITSVSVGKKNARVTSNKKSTNITLGIPGTGISFTKKIKR